MEFIDLGLPSKTLWANENKGFYLVDDAISKFGNNLPSEQDFQELFDNCKMTWDKEKEGYTLTGPNGNTLFLPCTGIDNCGARTRRGLKHIMGDYATSTSTDEKVTLVWFKSDQVKPFCISRNRKQLNHELDEIYKDEYGIRLCKKP